MKQFIPLFITSFVATTFAIRISAQVDTTGMQLRLKEYVSYLSSDAMKGRSVGTEEELKAGKYFVQKTKGKRKSKVLSWEFQATKKNDSIVTSTMFGRFINNKSDRTIIIGAHIDHIGYGDNLSLSHKEKGIHNGADDNASGVAALIELHNRLVKEKLCFNLLFVPFTAHEVGTFGSEFLVNHLPEQTERYAFMLNMDMIGRMPQDDPVIYLSQSDSIFKNFTFPDLKITLSDKKRVLLLDSKHFVEKGIASATLTTGMHEDYHKISDDEKYINYAGIIKTVLLIESLIRTNCREN
jgi:hypothetical protein